MLVNTTDHSGHLPKSWVYHGSDQLLTRFNKDTALDPNKTNFILNEFSIESLYRESLLEICRGIPVVTIAVREWFLENQDRIPDSFREYFRIYFLGTIAKHSFRTPCLFYLQKDIYLPDSNTQMWKPGWGQMIPQASVPAGSAFLSA